MNDAPVYRSSYGPADGPLLDTRNNPTMGVLDDRGVEVIGIAFITRPVIVGNRHVAAYRLTVAKVDLPGLYVVESRRYVPVPREPGEDG